MNKRSSSKIAMITAVVIGVILFTVGFGVTRYLVSTSTDARSQAAGGAVYKCPNGTNQECPKHLSCNKTTKTCGKTYVLNGPCETNLVECPGTDLICMNYKCVPKVTNALSNCTAICNGTSGCYCPTNCIKISASNGSTCGGIKPAPTSKPIRTN